jgi:amino acid transporter
MAVIWPAHNERGGTLVPESDKEDSRGEMTTSTTGRQAAKAAPPTTATPPALSATVTVPESPGYRVKRKLLGKPLVTDQLSTERLSKKIALGTMGIDMISSSAYGSEQMLTQLLPYFGTLAFMLIMPITGVILALAFLLLLCYRDVLSVYTKAGGSYVVAREQFGPKIAQIAAVALLIDYIVTVAVQTSSGTDAIASLLALSFSIDITSWTLWISIGIILLMAYGNLRGVREAGRVFATPAYVYLLLVGATVLIGLGELITGNLSHANNMHDTSYGGVIDLGTHTQFLLSLAAISAMLRGFANGGSSLTGLEAISNGVSVFKKPVARNARTTLTYTVAALGTLVLGISILAWQAQTMPYSGGSPTVLAQLTHLIWGTSGLGNVMFILVQVATALILYTGGNTSFSGFPFLTSFVASDSFLPRQFTHRGHRLAYSNGIIVLTALSLALIIVMDGNLTRLVALYAIGVFTGFVMASAGMFKYHYTRSGPGRTTKLIINGTACVASVLVVLVFAIFKFTEGAWIVVVIFPIGVFALIKLNERYRREAGALEQAPASASLPTLTRNTVLVLVDSVDLAVVKALRYARSLRPIELRAVHLMIDSKHAENLRRSWDSSVAADVPLEIVEVPDRRLRRASVELAARTAEESDSEVTILLPRRSFSLTSRLLHDRTADAIAGAVSKLPHVAAMIVPFDVVEAIEELEAAEQGRPGHGRDREHGIGGGPKPRPTRATKKLLLDAECPPQAADPSTPIPINSVRWRNRATLEGRVRSVYVGPVSGSPALEAELYDETGGITLVFLGRRSIPGIEPGARMRVEGMVGETEGYLAMANPSYVLLPRDGGEDAEE